MKHAASAALVAAMLAAPPLAAQPAPEPQAKPPLAAADMGKQMAQMQENIVRMQRLMDEIHKAKDPKERHALLDEHYEAMQENMHLLRGMGGPTMTGGGPVANMDPRQREELMQRRMDMMQMMMEQIMRHQRMTQIEPEPRKE